MSTTEKIEEKAMGALESIGRMYEKLPKMQEVLKLIENKETELRLKFENLTLDGDIALCITLLKQEKDEK